MKLSQSVTYAVHAALRLAEHREDGPLSCARLAESGHMPERFLLQILRDLAKQGILHSARGGGGGFTLDRHPADISLLEVIEAVEGPLAAGLPANSGFPEYSSSVLRRALGRIGEATRQQLAAVRLTDLLAESASLLVGGNGHETKAEWAI
jgi:Rrf2 family transcriptional regulator, cysteine metabolism repressor